MKINIGKHEFTELWDKVLYKSLSDYPNVSDNEIKDIIDFIDYEKKYGRETDIIADNENILEYVNKEIRNKEKYKNVKRPKKITECTACPVRKGCMTDFVCHTTSIENSVKIFKSGTLLSAINARKLPVETLIKEKRNAANDPADFFHYIMFAWGNCQAGDRLVMERKLNRNPTEDDLSVNFTPGIRFYFNYEELEKHPKAVHDGFLPIKVEDEVVLKDYVFAVIIPKEYEKTFSFIIPDNIKNKTYFIENDCKDIWEWSEKVYSFVEGLEDVSY